MLVSDTCFADSVIVDPIADKDRGTIGAAVVDVAANVNCAFVVSASW